jgi:hypothetical protein
LPDPATEQRKPTAIREETPRSGERGYDARVRKRARIVLALIVLLVIVMNVFLFLRFGLRPNSSAGPPTNKSQGPAR